MQAEARAAVRATRATAGAALNGVLAQAAADTARRREQTAQAMAAVAADARRAVDDAAARSQALIREITGQGPDKTLSRGFAMVRGADGRTVTSARAAGDGEALQIHFRDGVVDVRTGTERDPE
ncbi:MAG: hypothetical protein MZW92_74550 [Comamonadaceae bacterium]|nr:hypothetical protein [Comamonadaceae bacterium]